MRHKSVVWAVTGLGVGIVSVMKTMSASDPQGRAGRHMYSWVPSSGHFGVNPSPPSPPTDSPSIVTIFGQFLGINPIVTLGKYLLNMIENLV
jgi:hypothetical protein